MFWNKQREIKLSLIWKHLHAGYHSQCWKWICMLRDQASIVSLSCGSFLLQHKTGRHNIHTAVTVAQMFKACSMEWKTSLVLQTWSKPMTREVMALWDSLLLAFLLNRYIVKLMTIYLHLYPETLLVLVREVFDGSE